MPCHSFEFRLEGGKSISFGPPLPGDGGLARILRAPEFCRDAELAHCWSGLTRVQWNLSPIDGRARRTIANALKAAAVAEISGLSRGVAFVTSTVDKSLAIDLWLPATDFRRTGISTFEDWMRLIEEVKDDLNREALLRLHFPSVQEADLAAFKAGKRLATTGVELETRPRAIQWSLDD